MRDPGAMSEERAVAFQIPLRGERSAKVTVNLGVTGSAEAHKVALFVGSAVSGGNFMVNKLRRNQASGDKTLLAERMLCDITVADGVPASSVGFVIIRSALGFVVFSSGESFMFVAITPVSDKRSTAGIGTRVFGF